MNFVVRPQAVRWTGAEEQHRFTVAVRRAGDDTALDLDATFDQRPVFGNWLVVVGGLLLTAVIAFIVLWFNFSPKIVSAAKEIKATNVPKPAPQGTGDELPDAPPPPGSTGGPTPGGKPPGSDLPPLTDALPPPPATTAQAPAAVDRPRAARPAAVVATAVVAAADRPRAVRTPVAAATSRPRPRPPLR